MKSLYNGLAALALLSSSASAQETELPLDSDLMETLADRVVPFRYITVVPDFVVSITAEQQSNLETLEMPRPENQVQLRTIHLTAVFMNSQSGEYMSMDCAGIEQISKHVLLTSVREDDEVVKAIYAAQMRQLQRAGEELHCPARPFI